MKEGGRVETVDDEPSSHFSTARSRTWSSHPEENQNNGRDGQQHGGLSHSRQHGPPPSIATDTFEAQSEDRSAPKPLRYV